MKEENRKKERRALLVTSMDPLRRESALTKNAIFLRKFVLSPSPQKKKLEPAYPVTFPLVFSSLQKYAIFSKFFYVRL